MDYEKAYKEALERANNKDMETRYCIEYVNPRHPLCDNGSINIRYDRVLTLEQAEHDLTLILSFGGKILDLYMGNVVDGETGEWSPKPMIVDDDDWFTTDWLKSLESKWKPSDVQMQVLKEACDAYCKVCGHYAHSVPTHICRHDCRYFSDFKKYLEE